MKRPFIPMGKPTGRPSAERDHMERARARELLTTWLVTKDKALVDRHLAMSDKWFGPGAEQRVRDHMKSVAKIERHL